MIPFAHGPKNNSSVIAFGFKEIGPFYWIGNCKNGVDYYAGQTFTTPAKGILKSIKIFPSVVYGSANATLTLFEFDASTYSWKQKRAEATKFVSKGQENQWIKFEFSNLEVTEGSSFAFKISCQGEGMLAIAECPWSITNPYKEGVEWVGSSCLQEGKFQKDFDLAFEGEIEASPDRKFI